VTLSTTTAPDWSAWSRGTTDVRGPELPIDSADVRLRHNDVSTAVLGLPFTPGAWQAVGRGTRVEVRRHRSTALSGSVIDRELVVDDDHPGGTITVTLESDEGHLADRVCFPNPALPFMSQTNGATYRQTAPAETIAKDLVRLNAGPGALPERRLPGLTVEASAGRGSTAETVLRYDNLLTAVQNLARDAGPFGFRVQATGAGARVFRVFTPPDLSATVRFSVGLRNLDGLKYREGAPTVTHAMAEGSTAEVVTDGVVTTPATPLRYAASTSNPGSLQYARRAEAWFDAGDRVENLADVQAPVIGALGGGAMTVGLALDPSPDYLLDADPATLLGAVVTVQVGPLGYTDTLSVLDVVREVRLVYDRADGTDDVIPVVGSDGATADTLTPYVGDLNRRLSLLERR
jgi:Siphovirus ReqiPepy6 Gp37-like protein